MKNNNLLTWLKEFMAENFWEDWNVMNQTRSVFTTICIVNDDLNIDSWNAMLKEIYDYAGMGELGVEYNEFKDYMLAFLV